MGSSIVYKSGEVHGTGCANNYSKTHESPHRYLAYRDFAQLIKPFKNIHKALDLGAGTGASSNYLFEQGFDVIGTDISDFMIREAKLNFPLIPFISKKKTRNAPGIRPCFFFICSF